ncbi:MAG: hypothetical protein PHX64_03035 [Candidatus Omnitrophica bacterium]|nr:hypothetical protein [Candidatus Omnitrophota bacterium]MDD5310705.1 hypothetical protein [Candidatus Omnitrophota bacterium]MDD5545709.1 hypothetical protein [Candidatus Omnitrophota bacterium]
MRHRLLYLIILVAILFVVFYSPLTSYLLKDFITFKLEKALDMNVVFGSVRVKMPAQLTVSDIKAMDKDGLAFTAERAYLRLDPAKFFKAKFVLSCDFQNVVLKSGPKDSLNKLLKPFGVPSQNNYAFDGITGVITTSKGFISITDLKGAGKDFKFSGNFTRFQDKKIDYELDFGINNRLVAAVQERERSLLGEEEKDGWYSIKLSLKGDPHKPSSISFSSGGIKFEVKPVDKPLPK